MIVRYSCTEVRLGKAGLAVEKELAERIHGHAQTYRAARLLVRGFGDTAVCVASGVIQPHRLPHSRNAGTAGCSLGIHQRLGALLSVILNRKQVSVLLSAKQTDTLSKGSRAPERSGLGTSSGREFYCVPVSIKTTAGFACSTCSW